MTALFLAWSWLKWTPIRTLLFVLVGSVILSVPLVTRVILSEAQTSLTERAMATPLLLGPRGSQLDLVMTALYFSEKGQSSITRADEDALWESGLALPIPLHTAYRASGFPIVGTSLDYLDFRRLTVEVGRPFAVLGEVVLGATVASRLKLAPGDTLLSSPENLFDLDGSYPLEMSVVGVLEANGTPDDEAVFTDVKTTWVIAGIGHGHDDIVMSDSSEAAAALSSVKQFQAISSANIDSFHFHGDPKTYPLSAIIIIPNDERASTIIKGRYLDAALPAQVVAPVDVMEDLIARIFRIAAIIDAVALLVGLSALAAMGLALYLSWSLRRKEMDLARRIGAGRITILHIALAEISILLLCAGTVAFTLVFLLKTHSGYLVENIVNF